jgi:hypothetical protein
MMSNVNIEQTEAEGAEKQKKHNNEVDMHAGEGSAVQ